MSSIPTPISKDSNSYYRALQKLKSSFRGEVMAPDHPDYDGARRVWNGAYDKRPALVLRCADAGDVSSAVRFAREQGLTTSVRSGAHSMVGYSTNEGGVVIDLSGMKAIDIDPDTETGRVQVGAQWGEVAAAALPHGLALSSGDMGSVGVGGLTLGGGIGWLVRKYGLTIDHLLSAEVVTADGELITASPTEHADLFWALRGGGGNFGIATSFEFRFRPVQLIVGGAVFYDAAEGESVLRRYVDVATNAPDELTTMAMIMTLPPLPFVAPHMHGRQAVAILICYTGDTEEGQRTVAPLLELGTPVGQVVAPMPYPALFEFTKEGAVKGGNHDIRSMFLREFNDDAIGATMHYMREAMSPFAMAQLRVLGGAMSRVPATETAFVHRDKAYMFNIVNGWADPTEAEARRAWTERYFEAMQPYVDGVYVNFLGEEGEDRIRDAYAPATYRRLAEIKRKYDPTNFFRLNQNIKPAGAEEETTKRAA